MYDYLHTVCGTLPVWAATGEEELALFALEDAIAKGDLPLPRGLRFVET